MIISFFTADDGEVCHLDASSIMAIVENKIYTKGQVHFVMAEQDLDRVKQDWKFYHTEHTVLTKGIPISNVFIKEPPWTEDT